MCNSCRVGLPTKKAQSSIVLNRKNSVGKPTLQRHDVRDYDTPFGEGLWLAVKTSTALSLIFPAFLLITGSNMPILEHIAVMIGTFLYMSIITGFITLIFSMLVAQPVITMLRYFHCANEITVALTGGLMIFALMMWTSSGRFISLYYVVVFWGMACGYAFICGYNKGKRV